MEENDEQTGDNDEDVGITASYDFQWFRRGNGREYNSLTGQGNIVGHLSGKVLGVTVRCKDCAMCARGHAPSDHTCSKNYEGSAKGMEPDAAVELMVKNPLMKEVGVHVGTLIGDDDSSTMSAVRRESSSPVQKWSDKNHTLRGFVSKLYPTYLNRSFPQFTKKVLDYYKKCFQCALDQNKDNPNGLRESLLSIVPHTFGDHSSCGSWCRAIGNSDYIFKELPNGKPLSGPELKSTLSKILTMYAEKADSLAPGASSQRNESFNQMCVTKAPKSRHYGKSSALQMRVQAAALMKNEGATHILGIAKRANMSPSTTAEKYRGKLEELRMRRRLLQTSAAIKRRRLFFKQKRKQSDSVASRKEGFSYHSGMGLSVTMDVTLPAAADASPQSEQCVPVIVDIETCGLSPSAEIIQVAARADDKLFDCHMLPSGTISGEVTRLTGFRKCNGELRYKQQKVSTSPPKAAAQDFLKFLRSVSCQVVLVGHNIIRFDGPRIMGWMKKHDLLQDFLSIVHGYSDTLKLIGKGEACKRQEVLARKFLGPEWHSVLDASHNARVDCEILEALLQKFNIHKEDLLSNAISLAQLANNSHEKERVAQVKSSLLVLKDYVSRQMMGKMAKASVTFEILQEQYRKSGYEGIKLFLGQSVGGRVRVTTNKSIVNKIVEFFKCNDKENCEIGM